MATAEQVERPEAAQLDARKIEAAIGLVRAAQTILIPKNGNEEGATGWLREVAGLDVPDFPGRRLTMSSEGRLYRRLRDPEIVDGVQRREGDVGFLGLDKFEEWKPDGLDVTRVGDVEGCDFVLAAEPDRVDEVRRKLVTGEQVSVVTSHAGWLGDIAIERRRALEQDEAWNLDIRKVTGATEAFVGLVDMVADLRVTGNSLRDNGLEEFSILEGVHLGLIYPIEAAGEPAPLS